MKIGQTFTYRRSGAHDDSTLIILADERGVKFLFNLDYGVRIGVAALLNATPGRVWTKKEIREHFKKEEQAKETELEEMKEIKATISRVAESMGAKFTAP